MVIKWTAFTTWIPHVRLFIALYPPYHSVMQNEYKMASEDKMNYRKFTESCNTIEN